MKLKEVVSECVQYCRVAVAGATIFQFALGGMFAPSLQAQEEKTASPIKHVIIIVGENRTFDHIFATYKPTNGQTVDNLLSRKIINADGTPGPNFSQAAQIDADPFQRDSDDSSRYSISPESDNVVYSTLPPPLTGGPSDVCKDNGICTLAQAMASENGLYPTYYQYLLTGGTGQGSHVPDTRIKNVLDLPSGPFQLTSSSMPYDSYAASPVHRFYQMWQQEDCNIKHATPKNPSGCKADLFPWVEVTVGAGTNGKPLPANFSDRTTGEGSTSMAFYNVQEGDAPYLKYLADTYSMSDNYHQPVMGGTGANSIMLGFGDAIFFSDPNGNPAKPPENVTVYGGTPDAGVVNEIENPNPLPGTKNWYIEDGYGAGGFGSAVSGGGSYTNCSDSDAPGAYSILNYLASLPNEVNPKCDPGRYYLLNNYNPGYFGDGSNAYTDHYVFNTPFTIPPTKQHSIADVLMAANVSWKYYSDQWDSYLTDKYQLNYGTVGAKSDQYCNICNPFQYETEVMANASVRTAHLKDTIDFYEDLETGNLPAVSYVKPSGWVDGHPASSKLDLYEGFVKKIVNDLKANEELWESTAIFVTVDEGGGYYDAGYVQPLDFFGDGTRIPMIVVSPYASAGHISHTYADHVSVLKFIERNWNLGTISKRSRDNLPNPTPTKGNAYVPSNSPAIGDLFDLFDFSKKVQDND
jgi:phospholipase C